MQILTNGDPQPIGFELRKFPEESRILLAQLDSLVIENNILYRRFCHVDNSTNFLQIVLPSVMRQSYCERLHSELGHIGQHKSCLAFSSRAYFPGWRSYIRLLVRSCTVCNLSNRASNTTKQAPMQPMREFRPMAVLHADLVGPLPSGKSSRGHTVFQYILTIVDSATRYLWLIPLRRKTADAVAAAIFEQVISKTTVPSALITDRGKEFTNQVLDHLCKRLNITHFRTSLYNPACDGKCERTHFSVHNMLTKMLQDNQSNWPDLLCPIAMAYNATVHMSTGHTPFSLFYTFQPNCPLDAMTATPLAEAANNADTYAYQTHNRLQQAFTYVRSETGKQADRAKNYYDMAVKPHNFKVGDLVLLYTPQKKKGRYSKWEKFWKGPYRIIRVLNSVNFVIQKSTKAKSVVVHANRLRHYFGQAVQGNTPAADTLACKTNRPDTQLASAAATLHDPGSAPLHAPTLVSTSSNVASQHLHGHTDPSVHTARHQADPRVESGRKHKLITCNRDVPMATRPHSRDTQPIPRPAALPGGDLQTSSRPRRMRLSLIHI